MPKTIWTIGYEGLPPADLFALLREAGVQRLVDVRAIANSRKPGYSKRALAAGLEAAGIEYAHVPALGTPKEGREAVRAGRPGEMRRMFTAHLSTETAQAALRELADNAAATPSCLLCLEADPHHCHRTIIAEALSARWRFTATALPLAS